MRALRRAAAVLHRAATVEPAVSSAAATINLPLFDVAGSRACSRSFYTALASRGVHCTGLLLSLYNNHLAEVLLIMNLSLPAVGEGAARWTAVPASLIHSRSISMEALQPSDT